MGRKNIIPDLEEKIGQPLKPWMASKIREGLTPEQIAAELGIGKSKTYELIRDFDLKSVQKEVKRSLETGTENELRRNIEVYLSEKETAGISPISIQKDRDLWRNYLWWLKFTGNPINLSSITNGDVILTFFKYLETEKNRFGRNFKSVAGKQTILTYRKRMAAFFHWLQLKRIVPRETDDPFKMMMKIKIPYKLPEDMPDEILKMALDSFDNSFEGIRNRTVIEWFLETGMRLGGVSKLKINQFDWEKGVGRVTEKGNKQRTIVLSEKLQAQISRYMEIREPRTKSSSLWISSDGTPLTDKGIYQIVSKMNDIPGIREEIARLAPGQRFHPHLFRHVWAKYLALSEVPGFAMMVMAGWENLELVQHYAAAYTQEKAWSYINTASPLSNIG